MIIAYAAYIHIASVHGAACRARIYSKVHSILLHWMSTFALYTLIAHIVRPQPSCLILKQRGRRHYCSDRYATRGCAFCGEHDGG